MENNNTNSVTLEQSDDLKKISDLFKELKDASKDLAKAKMAYAKTKGKETISRSTNQFKNSMYTAGKNFGLKLQENANKYQETRNEIDAIVAEYELSLNTLQGAYAQVSEQHQLKIQELNGKKDELLAEIHMTIDEREQFMQENLPDLINKTDPLKTEQKNIQDKAAEAIKNGDIEEARKLLDKCENIKNQITSLEKDFDNSQELVQIDKKWDDLSAEYKLTKYQIDEAQKIATQLEEEFSLNCDEALTHKQELLAKVEKNKMFDKIKGFLSRSVLKKVNSAQKFNKEVIEPAKKNVSEFSKSIPQKATKLKEQLKNGLSNVLGKGKEVVEMTKDKARQTKDFVVNKARDTRDVIDAKIQDVSEGISTTKDYISGKAYQTLDEAYEFGKRTKSKARNCAIDKLESTANRFNEKAQELRNKEQQINPNSINKNTQEQGLF